MKGISHLSRAWARALPIRSAVAVSIYISASCAGAEAADQGLSGKKLLLKSSPKLVLLSKDSSISIAGSDAINGADSSVSFDAGGGPVTFPLPKALWSTNGDGTLFKYKNADAPGGPSVVKVAKVKPGLLKVVADGLPFAVPIGPASIDVVLSLDGGTNTYCMTFSGTGDGEKLLVKDAVAGACPGGGQVCGNGVREGTETCDGSDDAACPSDCQIDCTCPPPPACTGELIGGFCWFLGAAGQSCTEACADQGMACDPATATYAGSGGTDANCLAILATLAGADDLDFSGDCAPLPAIGCFLSVGTSTVLFGHCTSPPTTCDAYDNNLFNAYRACACQ